jgi:hypothetical protein
MCKQDRQIGDYRLKQTDSSVVIDERKGPASSFFDFIFGLAFMSPLGFLAGYLLLNGPGPNASQFPIGHWLIILPFLCVPFVFAYVGSFLAFARSHVEATSEKLFTGNTWCGVPLKLKVTQVSEIGSVRLKWEISGGMFGRHWDCVVSALSAKKSKPIRLCSSPKKEAAFEMANAIAEITKLPVQDIPLS